MSDVIELLSSDDEDNAAKQLRGSKTSKQTSGIKRSISDEPPSTKKRLKTQHVSKTCTAGLFGKQGETVMVFDPKSMNVVFPQKQLKIAQVRSLGDAKQKDPLAILPKLSEVEILPLKNTSRNVTSSPSTSTSSHKSTEQNGFNTATHPNISIRSVPKITSPVPCSSRTSSMSSPGAVSTTSTGTTTEIPKKETPPPPKVINAAFQELLEVCKSVEKNDTMDLITTKLVKYYHSVHPDFVNSISFTKSVEKTTLEIKTQPAQTFLLLKTIIDELKIRKGGVKVAENGEIVTENDEAVSTGDPKLDKKLYKLNKSLLMVQRRIEKLREQDAMWEDENNSTYLMIGRYEKRAVQIYEKICEVTGESTDAKRMVKRPVKFKKTKYPEFNRSLQSFVNKTKNFPDFYDVLKVLEYCNTQYDYRLNKDALKIVAQNAFQDLGETLQGRRKLEEYESLTYFASMANDDPANNDPELARKLEENKKYHTRIDEVINKYAEGRHIEVEELIRGKKKRLNSGDSGHDEGNDENPPELVNGSNSNETEANNNSSLPKTIPAISNEISMEPDLLSLDDVALLNPSPPPVANSS